MTPPVGTYRNPLRTRGESVQQSRVAFDVRKQMVAPPSRLLFAEIRYFFAIMHSKIDLLVPEEI